MNIRPVAKTAVIIARPLLMSCKNYPIRNSGFVRNAITRCAEKYHGQTWPVPHLRCRQKILRSMAWRNSKRLRRVSTKKLPAKVRNSSPMIKILKNVGFRINSQTVHGKTQASWLRLRLQLRPSNPSILTSISSGNSTQFRLTLKESGCERGT